MDFNWHFIKISSLISHFISNSQFLKSNYFIEILTAFTIDFDWYFIEISIESQLDFQWISNGISLKIQLNLQWISIGISLKFQLEFY